MSHTYAHKFVRSFQEKKDQHPSSDDGLSEADIKALIEAIVSELGGSSTSVDDDEASVTHTFNDGSQAKVADQVAEVVDPAEYEDDDQPSDEDES